MDGNVEGVGEGVMQENRPGNVRGEEEDGGEKASRKRESIESVSPLPSLARGCHDGGNC